VLGVLLVAIVDECQVQCVLLNNDVDAIVRRARPKLLMRWRYVEAQASDRAGVRRRVRCAGPRAARRRLQAGRQRQRLVRRERRPPSANVTRFRLSRASPTTALTIRLVFAIGSTPAFDDGALGSFHGSRRNARHAV
jgi:hypothetical protein